MTAVIHGRSGKIHAANVDGGRRVLTIAQVAQVGLKAATGKGVPSTDTRASGWEPYVAFGAVWWLNAFPCIRLGHRHAAALMSTVAREGFELKAPWAAFVIDVPKGLLDGWVDHVLVTKFDAALNARLDRQWLIGTIGDALSWFPSLTDDQLLRWGDSDEGFAEDSDDLTKRITTLVARLTVGVCLSIASHPESVMPVGKTVARAAVAHERAVAGTPELATYQLGRPVVVDCRPSVTAYLRGAKRTSPMVQWVTRGHWRNQPYGPQGLLRRPKWIEPHWNNLKKGGPINVRPHLLR